jgi:hypothetical protein
MVREVSYDNLLRCPFCRMPIAEAEEIDTPFGSTFDGGRCGCGAVYVFDQSGHNLGDAYVDALIFACGGDADRAWTLTPGEDYEVVELGYDSRRSRFSESRKMKMPTYLFLRLKGPLGKK